MTYSRQSNFANTHILAKVVPNNLVWSKNQQKQTEKQTKMKQNKIKQIQKKTNKQNKQINQTKPEQIQTRISFHVPNFSLGRTCLPIEMCLNTTRMVLLQKTTTTTK